MWKGNYVVFLLFFLFITSTILFSDFSLFVSLIYVNYFINVLHACNLCVEVELLLFWVKNLKKYVLD